MSLGLHRVSSVSCTISDLLNKRKDKLVCDFYFTNSFSQPEVDVILTFHLPHRHHLVDASTPPPPPPTPSPAGPVTLARNVQSAVRSLVLIGRRPRRRKHSFDLRIVLEGCLPEHAVLATGAPPTKPLATSGRAPSTRPAPAPAAAAPPSTSQTTSSPTNTMGESNPKFSHVLHGAHQQTKPQKSQPLSPVPSSSGRSTSVASETTIQSLNSSTASQPPEVLYKYTIQNIPQKFATQKQLYAVLITHLALKDVDTLKVNFNRSALLITRSELPANFEARLRVACLDSKVTINTIVLIVTIN